jgi:polar amino acid transport system substrate-binding protein
MEAFMPLKLSCLLRTLVATALLPLCTIASAGNALERVKQTGKLIVGINYVVPAYVAGAKFRTPEGIDTALAEDIARRLQVSSKTVYAAPARRTQLLAAGKADVVLAAIPDADPLRRSVSIIPTGYSVAPMAIMRTDTDIKTWGQLKGRKVCVAEGGLYVGMIAARYGAIEKVFKAPADSLLAVRTGECDAAVHDSALLDELIKLPEWKKFSATLPVGPRISLAFVVSAADAKTEAFLNQVTNEWRATGYLDHLIKKTVRHIAFEVYLDQNAPDCH